MQCCLSSHLELCEALLQVLHQGLCFSSTLSLLRMLGSHIGCCPGQGGLLRLVSFPSSLQHSLLPQMQSHDVCMHACTGQTHRASVSSQLKAPWGYH